MARFLYRIGVFSATHRKVVLAAWAAILISVLAGVLAGPQTDSDNFEIPGTESSDALSSLNEQFPSPAETATSVDVVFHADGPLIDPARADAIADAVGALSQVANVVSVDNPLDSPAPRISADGDTAVASVTYSLPDDADKATLHEQLVDASDGIGAGVIAVVGGDLAVEGPHIFGPSEVVGVVIAFLVLVLTFGSVVAAGVNMLTALTGTAIGIAGVLAFSAFTPIQPTTPILAVMLGLAVGIDYTLFVLARFRSELSEGKTLVDAIGRAVGTAGSAVVFAGATVIIALAGLSVVRIPFLTEMGLAAALAVFVAVCIALTLLPVILMGVGDKVMPRKPRRSGNDEHNVDPNHDRNDFSTKLKFFERWGALVSRRPIAVLIPFVLLLGTLSVPVLSLQTSLSTPGGTDPNSDQRQAYNLISDEFGAGSQSPIAVLIQGDDANAAGARTADTISGVPGLASMTPPIVNATNTAALINVTAETGPNDDRTAEFVQGIRDAVADNSSATVSVTGETAVSIDVNEKLREALVIYLILIVGLAFILLTILFRSLLVPLIATVGFLLSLGAGMGASIAIFQWGWFGSAFGVAEGTPILSFLPIIVVGILFGLAMDYQVFLVSRIRDAYSRGLSPNEAIIDGFSKSGPVVAAAAAIMAAVFAGFTVSGDPLVGSIAVALTVGVVADAFIVRMVIVPAVLSLLQRRAWSIPSRLDRVLPHVDTEGHALEEASLPGELNERITTR